VQIAGRALLLAVLIAPIGVLAIPAAFAITASLETLLLGLCCCSSCAG